MILNYRKYNHYFFIFIVVACFGFSGKAQNKLIFNDSLEAYKGHKGIVNYFYVINDFQHFKVGDFRYYYNEQDSIDPNYTHKILVEGNYRLNKKHNEWNYIHKKFKPTSVPIVDGYSVIHKSAGIEHTVHMNFEEGIANGKGEVITNQIENSELFKNLFTASSSFANNYFIGQFEAKSDSLIIIGNVDENGLFSDVWTFEHILPNETIIEKRHYNKGVITFHEIIRNGISYEIEHIGLSSDPDENGDWVTINANKDYFNIILRTNIGKKASDKNPALTNLIIENSNLFLKHSLVSFRAHQSMDIWDINNDNTRVHLPKLRVRKFPYTAEEKAQIEESIQTVEEAKAIIYNFLKDPQVEINKHAYRELALYYEIYTEYIDELLKLEKVFNLLSLKSYEYLNRDEIMPYIFEGLIYPSVVKFEYDNKESEEVIEFPPNLSVEEASIASLSTHAKDVLERLKMKLEVVEPIIDRNRKRFEIAKKEQALVRLKDSLQMIYTNQFEDEQFNSLHETFASELIDFANQTFKTYAKLPIEERIDKTDETIRCLTTLVESYEKFIRIQRQTNRIEEVYTRIVWNPFTFTDMEETVKERLYLAYKQHLLPYLYEQFSKNLSCNNIEKNLSNFEVIYTKMRTLRDEDTKEIERSLRRVNEPTKIIEILSLETVLN